SADCFGADRPCSFLKLIWVKPGPSRFAPGRPAPRNPITVARPLNLNGLQQGNLLFSVDFSLVTAQLERSPLRCRVLAAAKAANTTLFFVISMREKGASCASARSPWGMRVAGSSLTAAVLGS